MAPNLFILARNIFHPKYLLRHGRKDRIKIKGSISREEHWDEPVPGTYKYTPGQGWFLIRRDDGAERVSVELHAQSDYSGSDSSTLGSNSQSLPEPVVYNSILHRYILVSDLKRRVRRCSIPIACSSTTSNGSNSEKTKQEPITRMQAFWFLRLDDGKTWVPAWDDHDNFLPGPYLKWRYDKKKREMNLQADPFGSLTKLGKIDGVAFVDGGKDPAVLVDMLVTAP
ncbi:hypothetical protein KEM56_000647 [Ascosphaera pollenicola]|nr:hypothetical protein KEM56_000647 [Ascosphaera pollenicola]